MGRVGSTNLNIASWLGNCELDAVIEDEFFAGRMEDMYLEDLANATEIVLDEKKKLRAPGEPRHSHPAVSSGSGSGGRAAAGAARIGHAIGAAFTNRRVLEPIEARLAALGGLLLCGLAAVIAVAPGFLVYPVVALCGWFGLVLLYRSYHLWRARKKGDGASDGSRADR